MSLTPQDLARRVGRITSSTAAACLGLDPQMSQIDAWLKIRGEDPAGEKPKSKFPVRAQNADLLIKAIERGNRLEDLVLDYGGDHLGNELKQRVIRTPAPFRALEPWLGDSCDACYFPDDGAVDPADPWGGLLAIGEGKSASMRVGDQYGDEGTDEMPHHTLVQSHMHLIHWPEVDTCVVPVLVGSYRFEFRAYVVHRDARFEELLLEDLHAWHQKHIVGDTPPPARCDDGDWLKRRYPKAVAGDIIPDTAKLRNLAYTKWRATKHESSWKKQACDARSSLQSELGDASMVNGYWGKVTWNNNAGGFRVDWQSLAEAYLMACHEDDATAMIAANTRHVDGPRVLRVSVKKEYQDEAWNAATPEPEENEDESDE